jgi:hypothetical protein
MTLKHLLRRLSGAQRRSDDDEEQRYDNVEVISMADGTVIKGHDVVKAHFEREQEIADRITLFFNGRPMQDDRLFYADHFMLLPAWVQVHLHGCEFEEVMELAAKLRKPG